MTEPKFPEAIVVSTGWVKITGADKGITCIDATPEIDPWVLLTNTW